MFPHPTADLVRVLLRVQRVGQGERRHDRVGRRSGPNVVHRLRGGPRWRGAAGKRGELNNVMVQLDTSC